MKKYLLGFFCLFGTFSHVCCGVLPQNMPPVDPFELLSNMPEEEFNKLMEEVSKMPPELLEQYAKIGEDMFKQSGYNIDEVAQSLSNPNAPRPVPHPVNQPSVPQKSASETKQEKKEEDVADIVKKRQKTTLTQMTQSLENSLASLRQKASSDEALSAMIAPFEHQLDLLTAYIGRMTFEKHLKYLEEKEFAALKTKLSTLTSSIEELDAHFVIPDLSFTKTATRSRKKQLDQAIRIMAQIEQTLSKAFTTDTILTDIENLFKKFDQEALTLKKKIEDQQKKATEQKVKLPITNTKVFPQIPKYTQSPVPPQGQSHRSSGSGTSYHPPAPTQPAPTASYHGSSQKPSGNSLPQPPTPTSSRSTSSEKDSKKQPTNRLSNVNEKGGSETKTKDSEATPVPLTIEEQIAKIQQELRKLNVQLAANKPVYLNIVQNLIEKQTPSADALDHLERDVFPVKGILKAMEGVVKQSEDRGIDFKKRQKKILQDILNPTQLPDLMEIITEFNKFDFKTLPRANTTPAPAGYPGNLTEFLEAANRFKVAVELLDKLNKFATSRSIL